MGLVIVDCMVLGVPSPSVWKVLCICVVCVECGGKMHLREGEFGKAHTDFFESFKNYDESGSPRYVSGGGVYENVVFGL